MIDGTEKPKIPSKFSKHAARYNEFGSNKNNRDADAKSKGSVSQLMDDLDLIIEQVEVMVNSIQKGVENVCGNSVD